MFFDSVVSQLQKLPQPSREPRHLQKRISSRSWLLAAITFTSDKQRACSHASVSQHNPAASKAQKRHNDLQFDKTD
jgi:hypothetical protein